MSTPAETKTFATSLEDDYAELKHYVGEIIEDFAALKTVTVKLAANRAHSQVEHMMDLADHAREMVADYHERANVIIRERPFAAIGAALAAGFVLGALRRR